MSAARRCTFVLSILGLAFSAAGQVAFTGPGSGTVPAVKGFEDGFEVSSFNAYGTTPSGVTVALGDVDGDGAADVITGASTGAAHVKIFSGTTNGEIGSFFAYDVAFQGGVYVASGDVNGDGFDDIITGAGLGGGPHVKVFDGLTRQVIISFFAFDIQFQGGVRVASADYNGDRLDDIITAQGPGGTRVRVFSAADGALLKELIPFSDTTAGLFVAAGDIDSDGRADVAVAPDAGAIPHVRVFSGATSEDLMSFIAFPADFTGGVRLGIAEDEVQHQFILTGTGSGTQATVKMWQYQGGTPDSFLPYGTFTGGVFVAGYNPRPYSIIVTNKPICSEGGSGLIHVHLMGTPPWTLDWSDGFTNTTAVTPYFREVSTPGVYSVTNVADLHHLHGKSEIETTVKQGSPPMFTQHPQAQTVTAGSNAFLNVTATAAVSYVLFRGIPPSGTAIGASPTGNFTTSPLTQSASFYARAFDEADCSADSQHAFVTVKPARPTNVVATAKPVTTIKVTWNAVVAAASYETDRRTSNGPWVLASTQPGTTFYDHDRAPNTTYLYRVRALTSDGTPSENSGAEIATTIIPDETITAAATPVKAAHLTELRSAVNLVRAAAGLAPFAFTDPSLADKKVKAVHVTELRTALVQARTALGLFTSAFTDPSLTAGGTKVKRLHIVELRNGAF
jgi:hypothetical protein